MDGCRKMERANAEWKDFQWMVGNIIFVELAFKRDQGMVNFYF
jgi:hypothetical protein